MLQLAAAEEGLLADVHQGGRRVELVDAGVVEGKVADAFHAAGQLDLRQLRKRAHAALCQGPAARAQLVALHRHRQGDEPAAVLAVDGAAVTCQVGIVVDDLHQLELAAPKDARLQLARALADHQALELRIVEDVWLEQLQQAREHQLLDLAAVAKPRALEARGHARQHQAAQARAAAEGAATDALDAVCADDLFCLRQVRHTVWGDGHNGEALDGVWHDHARFCALAALDAHLGAVEQHVGPACLPVSQGARLARARAFELCRVALCGIVLALVAVRALP